MRTIVWVGALAAVGGLWLSGCSTAPKSQVSRENLDAEVQTSIQTAKNTDSSLQKFFDTASGYAVFPKVGKGAWVVGGAYGRGMLFQNGQAAGYCSLTQASIGLSAGGAEYTEIIFFETPDAVDKFKAGQFALTAGVRAVALRTGVAANVNYANNVAVFTLGQGGLMVDASVGGQKFSYQGLGSVPPTASSSGTTTSSSQAGTATVQKSSAISRTPQ
jgi:lipid-binding SYLF domain-containing protein